MDRTHGREYFDTIVIGGGQSGLAVGYHLARRGVPFVILDARARVGDAWRDRWDSLRLFTPARFNGLPGMRFPADPDYFPTRVEMGDYLESYARRFALPVRNGVEVDALERAGERFLVTAGDTRFEADNVVVAMATFQKPRVPDFARDLDPDIVQLHSADYRNPGQLREGSVLVVGAGNSGAEIGVELARHGHQVAMSGRDTGQLPFRIDGLPGRLILLRLFLRGIFHRLLTVNTPVGRKVRPKLLHIGGPLIRVKNPDLLAAGVERVPRTTEARNGRPVLEDGRVMDVANVIWCTGFEPGFDWIDLPVLGEHEPDHRSGIVPTEPGLFFVGLHFLHALTSTMIHGVGRDAKRIARAVADRRSRASRAPDGAPKEREEPAGRKGRAERDERAEREERAEPAGVTAARA